MGLKLLVLAIGVTIAWHLFNIWRAGRKLAQARDYHVLEHHKGMVTCVACLTLVAVVLIEMMVRISPNPYAVNPLLMVFHLLIVAALVLVFVATVTRFTGLKRPQIHGKFAYSFYSLYVLAIGTGSVMLYRLPL